MATYNINFGIKTRSGCGEPISLQGLLSGSISGTGASDWALTAAGSIAPSGTYLAYKTFSKTAGQTYNLTVGSDTVNITMVAARADWTVIAADTVGTHQLKTYLQLTYNASGALVLGDTLMGRDGTVYNWNATLATANIGLPTYGWAGAGTITVAGTGYTTGIYSATGGSGTNAQLSILASGGAVVQVSVVDPGIGYQVGDVLSVPGGTGFQYTVIDLAGEITIRSETPRAEILADGRAFGGGVIIANIVLGPGTGAPLAPLHFKYIDFIMQTQNPARERMVEYRGITGYGVSASHCYFAVPDEFDQALFSGMEGMLTRLCTFHSNFGYRLENLATTDGIGHYYSGTGTIRVPDTTVIRRTLTENVATQCTADSFKIGGTKNDVSDNFGYNYERVPGSTAHQDGIQHQGFGSLGYTLTDVAYIEGNIFFRGTGNGTAGVPQPYIFTDTDPPTQQTGITFVNNLSVSGSPTGITIPASIGPTVERNTTVCLTSWPDGAGDANARIYLKQGTGGLVDKNIANALDVTEAGNAQVGVDVTSDNDFISDKTLYPNYFNDPTASVSTLITRAAIIAAFKAKLDGLAKNADGTYNGAYFPDGTKNDGTIYQATPPTSISQSANVSTVTVGEAVTITYQLDAAANQSVTVTPGVSGVTGDFSAATAVIGVGEASAQLTFTPTSAGTATITAADNRSLIGPSNITVTVNAAQASPTAYTQAANQASTTLGGSITVTYTLNAQAVTDVTITPAVSGVSGVFSSSTVVITNGQTSGQVTFFPSSVGSGTLTATDDSSLTDPAGISITVATVNRGQLVTLGLL